MPALRKPHRVAVLVPELAVEGADAPYASEAGLLVWVACVEVCQRHPGLAVYDAESTPLVSQDGHFAPHPARPGATPTDPFYGPTRRDELIWLELALPRPGAVRLHTLARDGKHETFDALGRNVGEQIHQVLERWLAARSLGPLPRRFEAVEAVDLLAAVRVVAPVLAEQARAYVHLERHTWSLDARASDRTDLGDVALALEPDQDDVDTVRPGPALPSRRIARGLAARLLPTLKAPALRLLALALHEELGDLILAADPEQPQARFAAFTATIARGRDYALLREIIASAPCWARPYGELVDDDTAIPDAPPAAAPPSALETVAGAGIAALCRPGQLDVIETAADRLDDHRRIDEGIRLLERAVGLDDASSAAHIALVSLHRQTDREGAWLAQAQRSGSLHGCPMDAFLPWYPDQIQIDLLVADALLHVGRLDEAIALRANRLEGREAAWPRHTRILTNWRKDPRFVARGYAREGYLRGDPGRAVEGYGRVEPDDAVDVATFLDALIAMGREDEVALAWAQFGPGKQVTGPVARLAAARCLLAAGEWRRGIEELWRVSLTEPGRDEQVALARAGLLLSCAPIAVLETALAERVASGAHTLARRMARDVADFVPGAAKSSIVLRALGKATALDFDPAWLAGFAPETRSRRAIDALFAEARDGKPDDALARADRLVNRWLEVVFTETGEDDATGLAQAAAYAAAQALGRYLAATTGAPSPLAGGYRAVAAEALALVGRHRRALGDREARAVLGVLEPLLRRVDRWIGSAWLGTVERSCAIDERAHGDVAGFAREHATVAARILGPEETAVLSASVARLHRDRPDGWASAVAAQAGRLASHTGTAGADEWADAVAAQLAARELETDDAIDVLLTACYLTEGVSAGPCVHAARVLLAAGRAPAAFAVLCAGLGAADEAWRDQQLASLAEAWRRAGLDVPLELDAVANEMFEALQKGEPARAEKLGRFAVAIDPENGEAHRNLGLGLAQQGKIPDALHHLMRGTPEQATQILSGLLYQNGKLAEAMAVLDYASRWYVRADQWLTYGGIAYAAMDNPRTVRAYQLAYQLDPDAFDATQLNAYAGVLDEVGDSAACERIAQHLLRVAGDDVMWQTNAWSHLACALCGQGRFAEAVRYAEQAVERNPLPDNAAGFAATLERARAEVRTTPEVLPPPGKFREPVFHQLEAGDFGAAAAASGEWRVRRAALTAARYRFSSENDVDVTPRARTAATAVLADTVGLVDREAMLARDIALTIREQAYFARDPVPRLGDRLTRDAFYHEFRARGGVVLGDDAPPPPTFVDRVVVPGGRLERVSEYVSLLRDLAALTPREALAQFDLDEAAYLEVARSWAAAIDADPTIGDTIAAGLAKR